MDVKTTTNNGTETKQQAEAIIRQLGGYGRLAAMAGAKNFSYGTTAIGKTYASFRIGRNSKRVNVVRITLDANDTYTMEFFWATTQSIKTTTESSGVYNDMLTKVFEGSTGLYIAV